MVSGLVTSPWDQLRIFSGEASEMRMASKSVMGLVSSNGLERYKTTLLGTWLQIGTPKGAGYGPGTVDAQPVLPGVRTGLISNFGRVRVRTPRTPSWVVFSRPLRDSSCGM